MLHNSNFRSPCGVKVFNPPASPKVIIFNRPRNKSTWTGSFKGFLENNLLGPKTAFSHSFLISYIRDYRFFVLDPPKSMKIKFGFFFTVDSSSNSSPKVHRTEKFLKVFTKPSPRPSSWLCSPQWRRWSRAPPPRPWPGVWSLVSHLLRKVPLHNG